MVVFGWRDAVGSVTNRPVIAERLPCPLVGTCWFTVVLGWRTAVLGLTNRPVIADRWTLDIACSLSLDEPVPAEDRSCATFVVTRSIAWRRADGEGPVTV